MRISVSTSITASICWRSARAAFQFATSGHIVSGGSTLTMQVARLLEPREHRSLGAKLRQITRALELEHALSKSADSFALPDAGALWRQPRRRPRSLARLFRQGAAQADARGSSAFGGAAAVAGIAPARTAIRKRRERRATACSTARRRPAWCHATKSRARNRKACRMSASRCRCWRRMPPIRSLPPSPTAASTGSPSTPACRRLCRNWRASGHAR